MWTKKAFWIISSKCVSLLTYRESLSSDMIRNDLTWNKIFCALLNIKLSQSLAKTSPWFNPLCCGGSMWCVKYIPRNRHTVFALLCFFVVIHWLNFPYPSRLLHWHCGNLTIASVPAKQPWWIWINTSCESIMNDCITITKQSTTKPCAYFLGIYCRSLLSGGTRWCDNWALLVQEVPLPLFGTNPLPVLEMADC